MDIYESLRIIESDLLTLEKLNENPKFYDKILAARNVADTLQATNCEILYYTYQVYLNKLKNVSFYELTVPERFNDELYYNKLVKLYEKQNKKLKFKRKTCNIIMFNKIVKN